MKAQVSTAFRQRGRANGPAWVAVAAMIAIILLGGFFIMSLNQGDRNHATVELIRSQERMNTEAFRRYIDEAWNKGNLDVLGEVFTPDYVRHDPLLSEDTISIEGEQALITNFRSALPDLQVRIQDITADGNKVWVQLTITGTHTASFEMADGRLAPPSGNSLTWTITGLSRFEAGEIAEIWIGSDTLDLMQQLGVYADLQITIPDGDVEALIDAINAANDEVTNPGPDTITLAENSIYTLTEAADETDGGNGLPPITSQITLNGNGATIERSAADGTPDFRIFYVPEEGDLRLDGITISSGNAPRSSGGGIWNRGGQVAITNSRITGNSADISGGGIRNGGTLTINNSTFFDNTSSSGAGGIDNRGELTVTDSAFSGNLARVGGGIGNLGGGQVTISNSTFSGNISTGTGGGIDNRQGSQVTISNSTFSGNSAESFGGGIDNVGTMTIGSSTFFGNTADPIETSGIGNAGEMTVKNTIVADNTSGVECVDFTVIGVNLDTERSCPGFTQVTADALNLGPLADNGGPTQTHALLPGSVAIDADADCTDVDDNPLVLDQRGVERPQGAACDIGAFEVSDTDGKQ